MSKKNIKKIQILCIFILIILIGGFYLLKGNEDTRKTVKETEITSKIDRYNYVLYSNATSLYKEFYDELKVVLEEDIVNEEEYAKSIAKLFVADFYNLDNKITNLDIGGIQYFYPKYLDSFKNKAKDTIYKYVESNTYDDRKQELPIVSEVEIIDIANEYYKNDSMQDIKAYKVSLSLDYKKDLGYPKKVDLIIVHDNDKLYIIEIK